MSDWTVLGKGWISSGFVTEHGNEIGVTWEARQYDNVGPMGCPPGVYVTIVRANNGVGIANWCWLHRVADLDAAKKRAAAKAKRIAGGLKGERTQVERIAERIAAGRDPKC